MRLILGGAKGTGVLHFQGKDYQFKLSGVSVGGAGYTKVVSKGTVYQLNSIEDFPGTYSGMGPAPLQSRAWAHPAGRIARVW